MNLGVLLADGHSWQNSAFLSSYFTLVARIITHFAGLIWLLLSGAHSSGHCRLRFMQRLDRRLVWFWHFLDLVWHSSLSGLSPMGVWRDQQGIPNRLCDVA